MSQMYFKEINKSIDSPKKDNQTNNALRDCKERSNDTI